MRTLLFILFIAFSINSFAQSTWYKEYPLLMPFEISQNSDSHLNSFINDDGYPKIARFTENGELLSLAPIGIGMSFLSFIEGPYGQPDQLITEKIYYPGTPTGIRSDSRLIYIDALGDTLWKTRFYESDHNVLNDITKLSTGGYITNLTCIEAPTYNFYHKIYKLNSSGAITDSTSFDFNSSTCNSGPILEMPGDR
ncbi:MAG: hypothetical protein ACI959_001084, partial [Limisphaerales bacterium]